MNPKSKDPMVRYFSKQGQESQHTLDELDKSKKALNEMLDIMKKWNP